MSSHHTRMIVKGIRGWPNITIVYWVWDRSGAQKTLYPSGVKGKPLVACVTGCQETRTSQELIIVIERLWGLTGTDLRSLGSQAGLCPSGSISSTEAAYPEKDVSPAQKTSNRQISRVCFMIPPETISYSASTGCLQVTGSGRCIWGVDLCAAGIRFSISI